MTITQPPPIGPENTPGHFAHHQWLQDALDALTATAQVQWASPFEAYSGEFDQGTVTRAGKAVVLSMTAKNTGATTAAAGSLVATVPAGFRPGKKIATIGFSNAPEHGPQVDIGPDGRIVCDVELPTGSYLTFTACWTSG